MLKVSDTSIPETIQLLQNLNINACFLVPTKTGLEKSIMDATYQVRKYLKEQEFFNFDSQLQGDENKTIKQYYFVSDTDCHGNKVSLYRPNSKDGDPRIWFYGLKKYCSPENLLALTVIDKELYVLNCSNNFLNNKIHSNKLFLEKISKSSADDIFDELLYKMVEIHKGGYHKSIGIGHKGIGETLENILGIEPNSSKAPDYKGIELKATRSKKNRSNLFSCVPDWKNSRLKSTKEILNERGIFNHEDNRLALYHTLAVDKPNSYNLLLRLNLKDEQLNQNFLLSEAIEINDVSWNIGTLKQRLVEKHPKSFWVKADTIQKNSEEYFRYDEIIYTHSPNTNYFINLLEEGVITIDYAMHIRENGAARDHGYLFKILPDKLGMLFPSPRKINLKDLA